MQAFVDRFRIKTPSLDRQIKFLSGGNQQKVLLARWLMRGLKVIVVDEPTRGIDVGAKSEIFALIDRLAGEGLAVIMMTSEMPELLGLSRPHRGHGQRAGSPPPCRATKPPRRRS